MKRPTEFWAAVALALVIAYMIHDAYGSRQNTAMRDVIHIEEIVEDAWEPAGLYWEHPQACLLNTSDWPCMKAEGCA